VNKSWSDDLAGIVDFFFFYFVIVFFLSFFGIKGTRGGGAVLRESDGRCCWPVV
jgi:hypothetical protein